MLNVHPKTLVAIAGWFWLIAGVNVVAVGIGAALALTGIRFLATWRKARKEA